MKTWRRRQSNLEALAQSSDEENENVTLQDNDNVDDASDESISFQENDSNDDGDEQNEWSDHSSSHDGEDDYGYDENVQDTDTEVEVDRNDVGDVPDFKTELKEWFSNYPTSRQGGSDLLKILGRHGHEVPKDYRTFMNTPSRVDCRNLGGGTYIYFGIVNGLHKHLKEGKHFEDNNIDLSFNIDGVPLFKSTQLGFWPILGKYKGYEPFIIALWCGVGKPDPLDDYLGDFIHELTILQQNGFQYDGSHFSVNIQCFVCDAPARSYLKCVNGHTAKIACERCQVTATWEGRAVYNTGKVGEPRTDEEFRRYMYRDYQKRLSPLLQASILCVQQFCLDYMHQSCTGVAKRILVFLKQGPKKCKLRRQEREAICERLEHLSGKMPREFARQPRSLTELDRWKSTEFRMFILYVGPIVLRGLVSKKIYEHFLSFSIAIRIMLESDDTIRNHYLPYGKELLANFVLNAPVVYGSTFTVYNVHYLLHLHEDVEYFQCSLNDICAFPFENYLQTVKRYVRNSRNPIAQVAKRLAETESSRRSQLKETKSYNTISTRRKDSFFLLKNYDYAVIKSKCEDGRYDCNVLKHSRMQNFFSNPCESKLFNIGYTQSLVQGARRRKLLPKDFIRKVVCLPYGLGHVLFPMVHGIENA